MTCQALGRQPITLSKQTITLYLWKLVQCAKIKANNVLIITLVNSTSNNNISKIFHEHSKPLFAFLSNERTMLKHQILPILGSLSISNHLYKGEHLQGTCDPVDIAMGNILIISAPSINAFRVLSHNGIVLIN